jgi:(p)ppGpp synthase/HD superfamily hydrolase
MLKTSSEMLERALEIALEVHKGVKDKAGAPYIFHPLRVALSLDREADQIVGLLHDVLEDGQSKGWTRERLAGEGFPEDMLDALECVTKRPDEHGDDRYMAFIQRSAHNPTARHVKMADLLDNMNLLRIQDLTDKDLRRVAMYHGAYKVLETAERSEP